MEVIGRRPTGVTMMENIPEMSIGVAVVGLLIAYVLYTQIKKIKIENETVTIYLKDAGSPALIKDPSDFDSIFIVMPMKG